MVAGKTHKLDLINNSISYFREALAKAQVEDAGTDQWKFAIINVAQAMELAMKEFLRRIHPAFIYESVDKRERTVNVRTALNRMTDTEIGKLTISEAERKKIEKAFELRNELTHFEFNHEHDHIELKFAEIFSFLIFFYRRYLGIGTSEFIDDEQYGRVLGLVKARQELLARAKEYAAAAEGDRWICPQCDEATFVVDEEQCSFCQHKEEVIHCENCDETLLASQIIDTDNFLGWRFGELSESGEIPRHCCPSCEPDVKQSIYELERAQYDEDMEMDRRAFFTLKN